MFLLTYSITWLNFVVWLSLLLEMLGNMCIAIVCFPGCDVINFGINYIFLIKPFFYMTKKSSKLKSILTKLTRWYLCKGDAQVDIYLKLQLIKSNPVVFLLVAKDKLVFNFKSSVVEILVSCYLLIIISSLKWRLCLKDIRCFARFGTICTI